METAPPASLLNILDSAPGFEDSIPPAARARARRELRRRLARSLAVSCLSTACVRIAARSSSRWQGERETGTQVGGVPRVLFSAPPRPAEQMLLTCRIACPVAQVPFALCNTTLRSLAPAPSLIGICHWALLMSLVGLGGQDYPANRLPGPFRSTCCGACLRSEKPNHYDAVVPLSGLSPGRLDGLGDMLLAKGNADLLVRRCTDNRDHMLCLAPSSRVLT